MNNKFFASINSTKGFISYFDNIYNSDNLKYLYVLKGGPGTGKSTVMKKLSGDFVRKYAIEEFLCSSDTNSLDGVIIGNKVAVIDGTSPHMTDPKYPIAFDKIVNLAPSIKSGVISAKDDIINLDKEKKTNYKTAYDYLNTAGNILKTYSETAGVNTDEIKLGKMIDRFILANFKNSGKSKSFIRNNITISSSGFVDTKAFEKNADKIYYITNSFGNAGIVLKMLYERLMNCDENIYVSFDPINPACYNSVYLAKKKIAIVSTVDKVDTYNENIKVINMERFLSKDTLRNNKNKLKFAGKCADSVFDEAIYYFAKAQEKHFEIEKIYHEYIDFSIIDEISKELICEIKNKSINI